MQPYNGTIIATTINHGLFWLRVRTVEATRRARPNAVLSVQAQRTSATGSHLPVWTDGVDQKKYAVKQKRNRMNQIVRSAVLATLFAMWGTVARADQSNLVQNLNIRLSGTSNGTTETNKNEVRAQLDFVHLSTADLIQQLGATTGNQFSDMAKLVVVTPLAGGNSAIQVRDGSTSVDVTRFFEYEIKSPSVSTGETNLKTGRASSTAYSIQRLALVDSANSPALNLHLDLQGIAIQSSVTGSNTGNQSRLEIHVSGWGDDTSKALIFEGSVRVDGYSLEAVTSEPPPGV